MPSLTEQPATRSSSTVYSYKKQDLAPNHRKEVIQEKASTQSKKKKSRAEKLQAKKAEHFNQTKPKTRAEKPQGKKAEQSNQTKPPKTYTAPKISPASSSTQASIRKLIGMCGGDIGLASRLSGVPLHEPIDESAKWGVEKAIFDLVRDRR